MSPDDIGVEAAAAMMMESALVIATDLESAALTVKLKVPAAEGVPVMVPADVMPVPGGSVPL